MSDSQLPPVLNNISSLENAVIDAARRGTWAQPGTTLTAEQLAASEDAGLQVRAELIRELLMGRRGELDPRGVLIRSVRVIGCLNLEHVTAVTGLALFSCALPEGITCQRAHLRQMNLTGCVLSNLHAEFIRTDGNVSLREVHITGIGESGALWLPGSHIGGQLILDRATITNTGQALGAEGIYVGGHVSMRDAQISGASESGVLQLLGAHIAGQLILDRATITNTTGPALAADGVRTGNNLFLRNAHITGVGEGGALRLLRADIGGLLNLEGVTITNATGPALGADSVRTGDSLSLCNAQITGSGHRGALRLPGAHIDGPVDLNDVTITNTTGPALAADGIRTGSNLFLRNANIAGAGESGALRLNGAHIGGVAELTGTQMANESGQLLVLTNAQIGGALSLSAALVCLQSCQDFDDRPCPDGARRIKVRGLAFTQLYGVTWRQWLHLLVHHTSDYMPQPYQQLAAVERAAGHDNNARTILITQQHDLRRRAPDALGGTLARARHWLWGWLGRYGYRAHRLVTALLIVLVLAGATGYAAGQITTRPNHRTAERVQPPATPATAAGIPCSTAELIGLGIDRGLPVGATGLRARCDLDTTTRWGQAFTYLLWALQALLWALATLTIAAYTGLIRKTA